MQTVTFDVETLTPLFLAGDDQTNAELWSSSFRIAEAHNKKSRHKDKKAR
jgi:hypothetical protein